VALVKGLMPHSSILLLLFEKNDEVDFKDYFRIFGFAQEDDRVVCPQKNHFTCRMNAEE